MVVDFFHSVVRPVYLEEDVPSEFKVEKKSILRTDISLLRAPGSVDIVSWNILRNYSRPKIRKSLEKIIEAHDPNIILLQEVPVYDAGFFWDDKLYSGFNTYFAPSHQVRQQTSFYNFLQTGQLTLSRFPFTKTITYPLPSVARRSFGVDHIIKRLALYTQIRMENGTSFGIYNVHLENAVLPVGRKKQLKYLLDIIDSNEDDGVVIGGDFNTFFGVFEGVTSLLKKHGFTKLGAKMRIIPRLDHFFIKGVKGKCKAVTGDGSDHRPFLAQVRFH